MCPEEHNPSTRFHSTWKELSSLCFLQANLIQRYPAAFSVYDTKPVCLLVPVVAVLAIRDGGAKSGLGETEVDRGPKDDQLGDGWFESLKLIRPVRSISTLGCELQCEVTA